MSARRRPNKRIDNYAGPYERWVFSQELGRPYAFPAIRKASAKYFAALKEGGGRLPRGNGIKSRVPPLWNPMGSDRSITPFAFYDPNAQGVPEPTDEHLDQALSVAHDNGLSGRFRINFPIDARTWTADYHPDCQMDDWVVPDTRPRAIVAIIDDGIPFAHRAFLDSHGRTRMSHVWLQSAAAEARSAVPFGRELMNGNINALRHNLGQDEDRIYREAGAIDPSLEELGHHMRRHATHGSHVGGMCAGNDPRLASHPIGDDVQIIAVQLPNTIAWDTSGFGKEMYMLSAIEYVFNRAREIASKYATDPDAPEELPLIVNFSYGWSASRHDGQSEMELAIEELVSERKQLQPASAIVMPSGNNFDQDMHAQISAENMSDGSYTIGWKIPPDDRTSSYLEIWLPEGFDPSDYTVEVIPPKGNVLDAGNVIAIEPDPDLTLGDPRRFVDLETGGGNIGQLSVDLHRGTRWRILLALIPTVYTNGENRRAPSGNWKIALHQNAGTPLAADQHVSVWVHRDDDPASLRTGGRQSKLVDLDFDPTDHHIHPLKSYTDRLDPVRGYGCMNGVGSSASVTRVAGYTELTGRPCPYSGSSGLSQQADGTVTHWGVPIDISAVGDASPMLQGTASIGGRSGSGSRLSGTSGAAPAVSRLMVLNAAAGLNLMEGLGNRLPLHPVEDSVNIILEKHKARTGAMTAPLIGRSQPTPNAPTPMV